jgi:hypothetical protein
MTFMVAFDALYHDENYTPISPMPFTPPPLEITKRIHAPDPLFKKNTQALVTATALAVKEGSHKDIIETIQILHQNDLLKGEQPQVIFDIVISHKYPLSAAEDFTKLKNCGLLDSQLTPTIMQLMVTRAGRGCFAIAFQILQEEGLLKGEFAHACINAMVNPRHVRSASQNSYHFAYSLAILQKVDLLQGAQAQANFDALMNHKKPSDVLHAIKKLSSYNLLTKTHAQTNFEIVINHVAPNSVTYTLEILADIDLLKEAQAQHYFDALIPNYTAPLKVATTLRELHTIGLLTGTRAQTNAHNIIKYYDLLVNHKENISLNKVSPQKMTQEYLDELIAICQQSELSEDARHRQIALSLFKTDPEVFAYAEYSSNLCSGLYFCQYLSPFIISTLENLHQRATNTPPHTTFDLSDAEESRLCYYIIRNLIRRNSKEALDEIRFLLHIPAIRARTAAATSDSPENELLKLAATLDNQDAAAILLKIPEIKELAAKHNYYGKGDASRSKPPTSPDATPSKRGLFRQDSDEESNDESDVSNTSTSSLT